jgi:hypothetical protein
MSISPLLIWSLYHVIYLLPFLLLAVFSPFLRISSFLSISFFLSAFLQSCISALSFPAYALVLMFSWFFSFFIHNVPGFTITPFSQSVPFVSRSQNIQDSKHSVVSNTTLCFRFWLNVLQSFMWVLTLVLRVCGNTCAIHAQQIDHISGLVLFSSVGNIAVTNTSMDWNWGQMWQSWFREGNSNQFMTIKPHYHLLLRSISSLLKIVPWDWYRENANWQQAKTKRNYTYFLPKQQSDSSQWYPRVWSVAL